MAQAINYNQATERANKGEFTLMNAGASKARELTTGTEVTVKVSENFTISEFDGNKSLYANSECGYRFRVDQILLAKVKPGADVVLVKCKIEATETQRESHYMAFKGLASVGQKAEAVKPKPAKVK